jgi:hypothetical protein
MFLKPKDFPCRHFYGDEVRSKLPLAKRPEPSTDQASPENANQPRLLLKNDGKLPNGHTARYQLGLENGERVHVALQTEHDIDFAICTPASYQRWRATAKLTGSLHLARRTSNMAITLVAKQSGTHWVLIINNTRRKDPIGYTVEIREH